MKRNEFLKTCTLGCVGAILGAAALQSCNVTKYVDGEMVESDLRVPLAKFVREKGGQQTYASSIIVQHERIQFPICVYRKSETEYTALYMKCPHQGAELQVFGDRLHCPAHGSEFSNNGEVLSAPAISNLRLFPTRIENNLLYISLK